MPGEKYLAHNGSPRYERPDTLPKKFNSRLVAPTPGGRPRQKSEEENGEKAESGARGRKDPVELLPAEAFSGLAEGDDPQAAGGLGSLTA